MTKFGEIYFNSGQAGVAIFIFLQMIFTTFVVTKIVLTVYKYSKNIYLYIISVMFYCALIFYQIMVVSVAQDVLFSAFFALTFMRLIELAIAPEEWIKKKSNYFLLPLDIFIMCLFRNNGLYAIIFIFPFILLFKKKEKIIITLCVIIPIILYKIITGPLYDNLGVKKNNDGIKEASSIPCQQFARAYTYNRQSFSQEDISDMKKYYLNISKLEYYKVRPCISDPQKNQLNKDNVKNDLKGYLKLYFRVGMKNKKEFINAFLLNNLGLWFPNKTYPDERMFHPLIEYNMTIVNEKINSEYLRIDRNSKFPIYERLLNKLVNKNKWQKIPIYSTICTLGFYFILTIYCLIMITYRKNWKLFVPMSIIIGLYITIFLAPVSLFRYCFPIIICTPLLFEILIDKNFLLKK